MIIVLLGPPGAGKSTLGKTLSIELDILYISAGDALRVVVASGAALGKKIKALIDAGNFVSDELINSLVFDCIAQEDGFILDGFPRNVSQAFALESQLEKTWCAVDYAVEIDVPDSVAVERLSGRRVSPSGRIYHTKFNPPRHEGVDDETGEPLIQRSDDLPEVVQVRLDIYKETTAPVSMFYLKRDLLRTVSGTGHPDKTFDRLCSAIPDLCTR